MKITPAMMIVAVIVLLIVGYAAVTASTAKKPLQAVPAGTQIVTPAQSPATFSGTQTSPAEKLFNVEAGSFYFKPNEIRVKAGDKVRIVMSAVSMMHDFNIDELNVHMPIVKNGSTGTIDFIADQKGTFQYYCSVGSHRAQGQVGTLIVE